MSYVNRRAKELRDNGVYSAQKADPDSIHKIMNMEEWEYYGLEIAIIESYLGVLAQQAMYVQQEVNISEARQIELGNDFKIEALPVAVESKLRSVEERYIYASTVNPSLELKFKLWQESILETTLMKKLGDPIIEKLQVLKKIYDERRLEGANKNNHKYSDGSRG